MREEEMVNMVGARPYCLRYGTQLPVNEYVDGYTAHNECPPHKHCYIIERDTLLALIEDRQRLRELAAPSGDPR